jgi:hypothetical protein
VECKTEFMVVKVRFARGPMVSRRKGKNSRIATLAASLLTMVSLSCAALGLWRLGADLNWAGGFVFSEGFLSHWQVWIGIAAAVQYAAWRLTRYARLVGRQQSQEDEPSQPESESKRAVANV